MHSYQKQYSALVAVAITFMFVAWLRTDGLRNGESCADAFYHVAISDIGPEYFAGKKFPHMTMSVWKDFFYDKEMGFHFVLGGLRSIYRSLGIPPGVPFHAENLFFVLVILSVFAFCLEKFHAGGNTLFWLFLLIVISPSFMFRITMLRPHLLGITLMLSCSVLFDGIRLRRQLIIPFLCGFAFVYTYSQPHFILLPALAFAIVKFRDDRILAALIPVAAILGVIAGMTIHPQFPNTFIIWKVQCIDVPMQMVGNALPIELGQEMQRPSRGFYAQNIGLLALFGANLALLATGVRLGGGKIFDRTTIAIGIIATVSIAGLIYSERPIEYACPFTVMMTALVLSRLAPLIRERLGAAKQRLGRALAIGMLCLGAVFAFRHDHAVLRQSRHMPYDDFARWAEGSGLPMGTVVANLVWSEFPQLFYSTPQFRYLMGLDPLFGYSYAPERVTKLELFRTGQLSMTPEELSETIEARYAFVSILGHKLTKSMFDAGFVLIYQGKDGWLFDLSRQRENREQENDQGP